MRNAKYLRRVIMEWIDEKSINPEHVVPSSFLRPELTHESQSDFDSDLDTPRVPSGMGLCIQIKVERAGRTVGAQSSNEAEQKCSLNKSLHRSFKF